MAPISNIENLLEEFESMLNVEKACEQQMRQICQMSRLVRVECQMAAEIDCLSWTAPLIERLKTAFTRAIDICSSSVYEPNIAERAKFICSLSKISQEGNWQTRQSA